MIDQEIEHIDCFVSGVVMPTLLGCESNVSEYKHPIPFWWEKYVEEKYDEKSIPIEQLLLDLSRKLENQNLRLHFLVELISSNLINIERGYRELSLTCYSDINNMTQIAQDIVFACQHVIEDLDDGYNFGLEHKYLERDLIVLRNEYKITYCKYYL